MSIFTAILLLAAAASAPADPSPDPTVLRLGYFPNVTHATAIVGVERGEFRRALDGVAELKTYTFNAGPSAVEALLSGALDATYIGPNPALNAYVKSRGQAVRVIAGATSGGAFLVVDPSIASAADLKGKKIASPQLGNTQDVALRAWLRSQGLKIELTGVSDVQVVPQENAQTLDAFRSRNIAGAWVPEPWATRLVLEGQGKVLVDERTLWPSGRFVTTHLIVRTEYLREHPDVVRALLAGHLASEDWLTAHAAEAQETVNGGIAKLTGKRIGTETLAGAWKNLEFTHDPVAASLEKSARDAAALGFLKLEGIDVLGIYDLAPLNGLLEQAKRPRIEIGGAK